jgi:hypothetical protein
MLKAALRPGPARERLARVLGHPNPARHSHQMLDHPIAMPAFWSWLSDKAAARCLSVTVTCRSLHWGGGLLGCGASFLRRSSLDDNTIIIAISSDQEAGMGRNPGKEDH